MRDRHRPLATLALAALVGAAPLALPATADAQGKGRPHGQEKGKSKGRQHMDRVSGGRVVRLDDTRRERAREQRRDRDRRWDDDRRDGRVRRSAAPPRPRGVRTASYAVPPGHRPPPGLCRVWVAGVPPGRQPAPTDCARALRTRPANAQILWGAGTERHRTRSTPSRDGVPLWRQVDRRDGACVDADRDGRVERRRVVTSNGVVRTVCR